LVSPIITSNAEASVGQRPELVAVGVEAEAQTLGLQGGAPKVLKLAAAASFAISTVNGPVMGDPCDA
jgi:hypothetical protein